MDAIVLKRFQIGYLQFASDEDLQMISKHYDELLHTISEDEGDLRTRLSIMYIRYMDKNSSASIHSMCDYSSTFLYPGNGEGSLFSQEEIDTWNAYEMSIHRDIMYG